MRPDEHKKKKNAAYKKKHNIHIEKKSGNTSKDKKSSCGVEHVADDRQQTTQVVFNKITSAIGSVR